MTVEHARALRKNMTDAERALWGRLNRRQMAAAKFRRQQILGTYIVDFVCFEKRLIIEVDGGQHNEQVEKDQCRTAWLESQGFRVLRFWNNEILGNMDGVLDRDTGERERKNCVGMVRLPPSRPIKA